MYLRFVVAAIHGDSQREAGVFGAVGDLRDDGKLLPHEEVEHDLVRQWFNENLKKPTRFAVSRRGNKNKAISWFKDTAFEHLARVKGLVATLQDHGIAVRMLKTEHVGYVVYEDEYQIVAEPFAESGSAKSSEKTLAYVYRQRRGFLKQLAFGVAILPFQPLLASTAVAGADDKSKNAGKGAGSTSAPKGVQSGELHRPPAADLHRPPTLELHHPPAALQKNPHNE